MQEMTSNSEKAAARRGATRSSDEQAKERPVRVTLNLPQDDMSFMKSRKDQGCGTVTEAFRQAIHLLRYFSKAKRENCKILIENDRTGRIKEVDFPWL